MEKHYALEAGPACLGRTLWNNLVIGDKTNTLEDYEGFKRIVPPFEWMPPGFHFHFRYLNIAVITVLNPVRVAMLNTNRLKIEAETEENLRAAESKLKEICESKGVPICDADKPIETP